MRQNHLIKQAYVRGLAARGLLRHKAMQKLAEEKTPAQVATEGVNAGADAAKKVTDWAMSEAGNKDSWKDYATYGGVGALSGASLGALIQALRQRELLPGIAIGAGVGGGLGLGTRAALNILNTTGVLGNERLQAAADAAGQGIDTARDYANEQVGKADSWWNENKDMVKNVAMSGGIGAAGGGIIGALIQAAREKNILLGAGIGAGIGGTAGIGIGATPYITEYVKKKQEEAAEAKKAKEEKDKQEIKNLRNIGGMAVRGAGRGINWIQKQLERMGKDLQEAANKKHRQELDESDKIHGGPDMNGNTPTGSERERLYNWAVDTVARIQKKQQSTGRPVVGAELDALREAQKIVAGNY